MDISNNIIKLIHSLPIDKIVYINLDDRTDRREQIEKQLEIFPKEKILRYPGIKHQKGIVGCGLSHINVIKMAIENKWENVLIFEDDAIIRNEVGFHTLNELLKKNYDVITLSISYPRYEKKSLRLYNGHTTASYIVNKNYYNKLLTHYEKGLELLISSGEVKYYIDQYWCLLQKEDIWYCVIPSIYVQCDGYSDIEKRNRHFHENFFK